MNSRFLMSGILFLAFSLGATSFDELYQQGIGAIRKGDRVHALSLFEKASALAKGPEQKTNAILQRSLAMPREKEKEGITDALELSKEERKTASFLREGSGVAYRSVANSSEGIWQSGGNTLLCGFAQRTQRTGQKPCVRYAFKRSAPSETV